MSIHIIEKCVEKFAPKESAEDWDNTGVLIDSMTPENSAKKILLCIDLTSPVIQECIDRNIKYVISYHPCIFSGIKKICNKNYVKLIKNGISVYSPHTQLDPLMNKYIIDLIGDNPVTLEEIIIKIKDIAGLKHLRCVQSCDKSKIYQNNGDIIAGVGAAFRNVTHQDCLLITGEMSHHDLLKCKYSGTDVILMEHSNSERIFLKELKKILEESDDLKKYEIIISQTDQDPINIV